MHRFFSRIGVAFLVCITLGLCLFTAACSDTSRDQGSSQQSTATVKFQLALTQEKGDVSCSVQGFEFIGYIDEAMSQECDHEPWLDTKTDSATLTTQTVTLNDVPIDVVRFRINYRDDEGNILGYYDTDVITLTAGATQEVTVGSIPMFPAVLAPATDVTLKITNAYGLATAKAKYTVTYNSTVGEAQTATGTADYAVADGLGSCIIAFAAQGEDIAVTSVKLSNPANDIPFEWLDYAEPQAVTEGSLELDVTKNKFASNDGDGSADNPYLVGNPRQLDNVREKCGTTTSYKQIRDIDFEGSCGLTISVSVADSELKSDSTAIDETARFYNSGKGWAPIGSGWSPVSEGTPFLGTYDGGGHTIDGLAVFAPDDDDQGLFGYSKSFKCSNLTLGEHCTIVGFYYVGGLLGGFHNGSTQATVNNCHIKATIAGGYDVGGFIGTFCLHNVNARFLDSSFSGKVYARSMGGGCCGYITVAQQANIINYHGSGDIYIVRGGVLEEDLCEGRGAGLVGGMRPTNLETDCYAVGFTNCTCTSTIHVSSKSQDCDIVVGGFIGELDDHGCVLTLPRTNIVTPQFDFSSCLSEGDYCTVGGLIGQLLNGTANVDNLVNNLRMSAKIWGLTIEPKGIPTGKYCGSCFGNPSVGVDSL